MLSLFLFVLVVFVVFVDHDDDYVVVVVAVVTIFNADFEYELQGIYSFLSFFLSLPECRFELCYGQFILFPVSVFMRTFADFH